MSNRAIATSTLWQMGSQIAMAALSIVTVKFVTLGLSMTLAGYYNSAYGYLQIFGILADFGLYAVAVRELSKSEDKEKTFGTLLVLRTAITFLSLGGAIFIAWVLPAWKGTPLPLSVTIAAFVPFFTLQAGIIRSIFQTQYRMHFVFVAEVLQRMLTVAATGLIIWVGIRHSTDPHMEELFLALGSIGACLLYLISRVYGGRLLPIHYHLDKPLLRATLFLALPYGLAFFFTTLYRQFDVTMISQLRPDFAVQNAYYGFVQRMMDMAYLLPTFLLNSTLPILAERSAKGDDTRSLMGKTLFIILLIGITALLFSALWSRPLMELLTSAQYLSTPLHPGSDTALRLLSLSMFFNGIILFSFYSMLTKHVWKPLVITLAGGAAFSLMLNAFLIPRLGFVGASLTSVLTHGLLAGLLFPQSLRVLPVRFTWRQFCQWARYALLLGIGLALVAPLLTSSLRTAIGLAVAIPYLGVVAWILKIHKTLA